jgi:ribosome-associated protein
MHMENNKVVFTLTKGDYIQLNDLLKVTGLVGTGGEAKMRILDGEAEVNGQLELAIRKKIRKGDSVKFSGILTTVE